MATSTTTSTARVGSPPRAVALPTWWAGAAVAVLSWFTTLAGLALLVGADVWSLPVLDNVPVDATIGLAFPLVGIGILIGAPSEARSATVTAWLLLGTGAAAATTVLATAFVATARSASPAVTVAVGVQSWSWVPATVPLLTLLPLRYPDGLLPGRHWRLIGAAAVASVVLLAGGVAVYPEDVVGRLRLSKPWTSSTLAVALTVPGAVLLVVSGCAGLAALVIRLRQASGLRRRQITIFLVAAAVVLADLLLEPLLPTPVSATTQAVAFALLPVALGVAVTRSRLYELDLAVARGLVAVSLAFCLAGVYLSLFALLSALGPGGALAGAGAAGVTGLVVQPLGSRLTRSVDRLFYGDRAEPVTVLRRLSAQIAATDALAVPQLVCTSIVDSLRLGSASLAVIVEEDGAAPARRIVATTSGTNPSVPPTEFDLRHRGELLGTLAVSPRPGEGQLGARDRELLTALAGSIAPALSAVRLSEALRRSRESLVAAREEERRRLRRDLHDGVGAALAGIRLQLESVRELVPDARAGRLLDAAAAGVAATVTDVRRVTEDLRPPALDDLGLLGSLAALVDRFDTPHLPVGTDFAGGSGSWPAAVEVACYRIVAEALANAVRHSHARRVLVRLSESGENLLVVVSDDGRSVGTHRRGGLGLASMRRRAEEIGGRCLVEFGPGGTVVRATLPQRLG